MRGARRGRAPRRSRQRPVEARQAPRAGDFAFAAGFFGESAAADAPLEPYAAERGGARAVRFSRLRYLGQALGLYLVLEADGALVLVDQHAAHERVLFERLRRGAPRREAASARSCSCRSTSSSRASDAETLAAARAAPRRGWGSSSTSAPRACAAACTRACARSRRCSRRARARTGRRSCARPRRCFASPPERESRDGLERALHHLRRHRRVSRGRAQGRPPRRARRRARCSRVSTKRSGSRTARTAGRSRGRSTRPSSSGASCAAHERGAAARRRDRRADGHGQDRARLRGRAPQRAPRVVSADSMQVYRGMDVGTAKPARSCAPRCRTTRSTWSRPTSRCRRAAGRSRARRAALEIHARGRPVLLVGGTGLYARAFAGGLIRGAESEPGAARRARGARHGRPARRARAPRPAGGRAHPAARPRAHRARARGAGARREADQEQHAQHRFADRPFDVRWLGLALPRDTLAERLRARVAAMFAAGWVDEVRALHAAGYDRKLRAAAGDRLPRGRRAPRGRARRGDGARERIWIATRRYAKRQRTWFRAEPELDWIDADDRGRSRRARARRAQPSLIVLYDVPKRTGHFPPAKSSLYSAHASS